MFENPRRGRQARTFTTKNSRSQIVVRREVFQKLSLDAPAPKAGRPSPMQGTTNSKSTGTLRHVYVFYRLLRQRLNSESCFTNLEQTPLTVVNSYRHGTNHLLTESSKPNYERTTGQLWVTGWWERGRWQISRKLSPTYTTLCCK